jgi:DNA-binding MurR/RpiR family transcriptional regulator
MATSDSNTPEMERNKEKAIAALLVQPSIEGAAKSAGISEATLLRWLKDEAFKTSYRDARREVVSQAVTQLQSACGKAVKTLCDIAEDKDAPASSRVSAARAILDTSIKAVELEDLAQRIEALEAAATDKTGRNPRWH